MSNLTPIGPKTDGYASDASSNGSLPGTPPNTENTGRGSPALSTASISTISSLEGGSPVATVAAKVSLISRLIASLGRLIQTLKMFIANMRLNRVVPTKLLEKQSQRRALIEHLKQAIEDITGTIAELNKSHLDATNKNGATAEAMKAQDTHGYKSDAINVMNKKAPAIFAIAVENGFFTEQFIKNLSQNIAPYKLAIEIYRESLKAYAKNKKLIPVLREMEEHIKLMNKLQSPLNERTTFAFFQANEDRLDLFSDIAFLEWRKEKIENEIFQLERTLQTSIETPVVNSVRRGMLTLYSDFKAKNCENPSYSPFLTELNFFVEYEKNLTNVDLDEANAYVQTIV